MTHNWAKRGKSINLMFHGWPRDIDRTIDALAAFGFNVVRIHHHDNEIYDRSGSNSSRIDAERVDRLDYLLACLKYVEAASTAEIQHNLSFTQGSYGDIMSSLARVKGLLPADTTILPGHGPQTTMARELSSNPYMR